MTTLGVRAHLILESFARHQQLLLLLVILALAATLRFYRLDTIPPGLSTDDALEASDATAVLDGHWQIFFPGGGGREPLFVYAVALAVNFLGPTTLAVHLPVALAGVATVLALYLCARELFDWRVGVLTAALVALSYWHLHESRTGQRAILVPLVTALAFYFFWRGWKTHQPSSFVAAGVCFGLTWYTYGAARVVPLILLALVGALARLRPKQLSTNARNLSLCALCALIMLAPLAIYFWLYPESLTHRMMQVSSNELTLPGLLAAFGRNLLPTFRMFSFAGDAQWKYNLPGRPVFDALGSAFFYSGIGLTLARSRRPEYLLLLLWLAIGLLPGALSDESPHFLRTIVALPVTYIFPALALVGLYDYIRTRGQVIARRVSLAAIMLLLVYWGALTTRDYFEKFANAPEVYQYFYGDLSAVADFLSRQDPDARAYLSVEYSDLNATQMRYYSWRRVFPPLRLFDAARGWVSSADPPTALYVLPLTAPASDDAFDSVLKNGTLVQASRAANGLLLFRAYRVNTAASAPEHPLNARVGEAVELRGYDLSGKLEAGQTMRVNLRARALKPGAFDDTYKFFVHLVDRSGYTWSGDEGIASFVPMWQAGEEITSWFNLPIPPDAPPKEYFLDLGLYSPLNGRVAIANAQGQLVGASVLSEPIRVAGSAASAVDVSSTHPLENAFLNELTLRGYDLSAERVSAADTLRVTLVWQAQRATSRDYNVVLALVDAGGERVEKEFPMVEGAFPTSRWRAGEVVRDPLNWILPAELSAGDYTLQVRLADAALPTAPVTLTTIHIAAPEHRFTIPPIQNRLSASLGDNVQFIGYDLATQPLKPGDMLPLTVYWRANKAVEGNYTVFVHVIDQQNRLWGQRDRMPLGGARPTFSWLPGEVLVDRYRLPVAPDAPPGLYSVEIGMYDPNTLQRLPAYDDAGNPLPGDRILFGAFQVQAP